MLFNHCILVIPSFNVALFLKGLSISYKMNLEIMLSSISGLCEFFPTGPKGAYKLFNRSVLSFMHLQTIVPGEVLLAYRALIWTFLYLIYIQAMLIIVVYKVLLLCKVPFAPLIVASVNLSIPTLNH